MKLSKGATIVFYVFAVACLILGMSVVPESLKTHVITMGLASAGLGLISAQMWSLHKELSKLHGQQNRSGSDDK